MSHDEVHQPVYINGLQLPTYLIQLINEGRWGGDIETQRILTQRIREMAGLEQLAPSSVFDIFSFDGIETMKCETEAGIALFHDGYGEIYGLTSSSSISITDHSTENRELLDVQCAIIIGGTRDEEVIALDYRLDVNNPVVVLGYWEGDCACRWRTLALDFVTFAERLGL